MVKRNVEEVAGDHSEDKNADKKVQLIMSTATLTKAVRLLLNDVQGGFNIEYSGTHVHLYGQSKPTNISSII